VFLERNFVPVLEYTLFRCLPRFTDADRVESVRAGTRRYREAGTTAGWEGHGLTPALLRAYREVHEREGLPLRLHAPVSLPTAAFDDRHVVDLMRQWAAVAGGRGLGDETFRVAGLTLGGAGDECVAAIVGSGYPYEQWAGHFNPALAPERFTRLALEAARLGLRVGTIVSRDLESALSALEAIDREIPIRDRRWVLIHVNQATPAQLGRMKALGVVVTATPGFLYMAGDRYGLDAVGAAAIPLREMLDAGIPVALGTDGVPPAMTWTLWEALARRDGDARRRLGDSRLTREEALRLCVQTGHRLTWAEDRLGSIEIGKLADLAVLSEDPLTCPEDRLERLAVDLTLVGGDPAGRLACR
jgi:predicted amidohydrolase YtcJ